MSAIAPARQPARTQTQRSQPRPQPARPSRPTLRVVTAPRGARSAAAPTPLPFALVVAGVLGAGLIALLMLHTLAAQDAFTLHKLQRQTATLADAEQQLTLANQQAQAPSALAARAKALGMVPTGSLHIVRRRDGRIVAIASAVPAPAPAPSTSPSAAATQPGTQTATQPAKPSASASAGAATKPTGTTSTAAQPKPKPTAKRHRPR